MQDNSGNADAGEIVADYCEPAEAAQQIATDPSAAERVMAALPFPDCADFIRYANRRTLFMDLILPSVFYFAFSIQLPR